MATIYDFPTIDYREVDQLRGLDARQMMKLAKLPSWKMPFIAHSFIQLMYRYIHQIHLFDGIHELLEKLATQGVKLAIVSSNSEENVRYVLGPERASLISYYGCGTSLFSKQRKFKQAILMMKIKPEETLCIGDEQGILKRQKKQQQPSGELPGVIYSSRCVGSSSSGYYVLYY